MDYWRKIGEEEPEHTVELKHYESDPSKWYLNPRSKLYCSLASGLPNEIDFALRAATLLANSGQFDWFRDYRFIDLVLESQINYACVCDLEEEELEHAQREQSQLLGFQLPISSSSCSSSDPDVKSQITDTPQPGEEKDESDVERLMAANPNLKVPKAEVIVPPVCHCWYRYWHETLGEEECDPDLMDLLLGPEKSASELTAAHPALTTTTIDGHHLPRLKRKVSHRIKFIADLLHLLSFSCENETHPYGSASDEESSSSPVECCVPVGTSCALMRYLALLIHCDDSRLRNIGWDILANVAPATTLNCPLERAEYTALQRCVYRRALVELNAGRDMQVVSRTLEILSKLITCGVDEVSNLVTRSLRHLDGSKSGSLNHFSRHLRPMDGEDLRTDHVTFLIPPVSLPVRLTHLLTSRHDVYLVVSCLEFCLILSEYHPATLVGPCPENVYSHLSSPFGTKSPRRQRLALPQGKKISSDDDEQGNEHYRTLIRLMINLLSIDVAKHFTPAALSSIRTVDEKNRPYVPAPLSHPHPVPGHHHHQGPPQMMQPQPQQGHHPHHQLPPGVIASSNHPSIRVIPNQQHQMPIQQRHPQMAVTISPMGPRPGAGPTAGPHPSGSVTHQPQYANQIANSLPSVAAGGPPTVLVNPTVDNNEQFATNWLSQTFEHQPSHLGTHRVQMKLNDVFADYIRINSRLGRKQVLPLLPFGNLLQKVFPKAVIRDELVEGIIQKGFMPTILKSSPLPGQPAVQLPQPVPHPQPGPSQPVTVPGQPQVVIKSPSTPPPVANGPSSSAGGLLSSPILKAQLSAPPKVSTSPPQPITIIPPVASQQQHQQQAVIIHPTSTTTPVGSPATTPVSNSSNLIKTLLATKIRAGTTMAGTGSSPNAITIVQNSTINTNLQPGQGQGQTVIRQNVTVPPQQVQNTLPSHGAQNDIQNAHPRQHTIVIASTPSQVPVSASPSIQSTPAGQQQNNVVSIRPSNVGSSVPVTTVATRQTQPIGIVQNPTAAGQNQQQQQSTITLAQGGAPGGPQQFFLVRTIIAPQGQQGGAGGQPGNNNAASGGTPVRLLLPASAFTNAQQRQALGLNGVTPNGGVGLQSQTHHQGQVVTSLGSVPGQPQQHIRLVTSTAPDGTLKQMLAVPNSINQAAINGIRQVSQTVRSSPLLNVLLDKGKLPDSNAEQNPVGNQNIAPGSSVSQVLVSQPNQQQQPQQQQQQQPKLLILSTKGPVPIKGTNTAQIHNNTNHVMLNGDVNHQIPNNNSVHHNNVAPSTTPINCNNPNASNSSGQNSVTITPITINAPPANRVPVQITGNSGPTEMVNTHAVQHQIQAGPGPQQQQQQQVHYTSSPQIIIKRPAVDSPAGPQPCAKRIKTSGTPAQPQVMNVMNEQQQQILQIKNSPSPFTGKQQQQIVIQNTNISNHQPVNHITSNNSNNNAGTPPQQTVQQYQQQIVTHQNVPSGQQGKIVVKNVANNRNHIIIHQQQQPINNGMISGQVNNANQRPAMTITANNQKVDQKAQQNVVAGQIAGANPAQRLLQFRCEWNGCKRVFYVTSQVFIHVFREHLGGMSNETVSTCQWTATEGVGPGCKMPRPKLSLLTHILDFHCSDETLKRIAKRQLGMTGNVPPPPVPAQHPGYAQNAAFLAIKRHSINYHEPVVPPPSGPFGPLTVSIRLTAALILRNLAQSSTTLASILSCHETYLSVLSIMDGREESRTLAQTLAVISEKSPKKKISHLSHLTSKSEIPTTAPHRSHSSPPPPPQPALSHPLTTLATHSS